MARERSTDDADGDTDAETSNSEADTAGAGREGVGAFGTPGRIGGNLGDPSVASLPGFDDGPPSDLAIARLPEEAEFGGDGVNDDRVGGPSRGPLDAGADTGSAEPVAVQRTPSDSDPLDEYDRIDPSNIDASEVEVDDNKLHHIFGQKKHDLDDVVKYCGSEGKAFIIMKRKLDAKADAGKITGVYEETISIGPHDVTVRGKVVNGEARIGTAWNAN